MRHYGNVRRKQLTAWSDLNLQERGKQSGMGSFSPFLPHPPAQVYLPLNLLSPYWSHIAFE